MLALVMNLATTLTFLLNFPVKSHGWLLDRSCRPYQGMIVEAMQSALGLAEAGSDALNQLSQPGDGPTAVAQRDLFSYLFAEAMKNGHIDTSNKEWQHFTSGFSAVLNYKKTPDGSPEQNDGMYGFLHMDDLIVYCDYSRFQENKDCQGNTAPGKACDTSINVEVIMTPLYSDCKKTSRFSSNQAEAWTKEWASLRPRPSQLQLCPRYLTDMQKAKMRTVDGQGGRHVLARAGNRLSSWLDDPFRTAMDQAMFMDGVLLHELTHAIPRRPTKDIEQDASYGWKNCVRLSGTKSSNNAESYAFFGLGSYMISTRGERPMRDGKIQVLPGAQAAKREVPYIPESTLPIPQTSSSIAPSQSVSINRSASIAASLSGIPSFGRPTTLKTSTRGAHSQSIPMGQSSAGLSLSQLSSSSPGSPGSGTSSSSVGSSSHVMSSPRSSQRAMSSLSSSSTGINIGPSSGPITSAPSIFMTFGGASTSGSVAATPFSNTMATVTSGSSSPVVTPIVVVVSKSGTTTQVTYVPTYTSSDGIKPTTALMCTGPLCDTSSRCLVPLFCRSESSDGGGGLGGSLGLCCEWQPQIPRGGGPPVPGGPSPEPDDESDNEPSSSSAETSSTETSSSSSSSRSSTSSSSSSSSESSSEEQVPTGAPVGDRFLQWDLQSPDWYDKQQSILAEAMADTTDPYITWTPPAKPSASMTSPTASISTHSFQPTLTTSSSTTSSAKASSSPKTSATSDNSSALPTFSSPMVTSTASSSLPQTNPTPASAAVRTSTKPFTSSSPASASPSVSAPPTTPPEQEQPCLYDGDTTGVCYCLTTVSGQVYHTTALAVAKDCATYTTYPGSITPITSNPFLTPPIPSPFTTSQAGGEIDVYPSQSVDIFQIVGGLRVTQTVGVGPASTIIPPAPTEISGNNKGSGICQSTGDACDRAYHQFDDDRLYTSYAAYAAEVDTMVLQGLTFGKGRCIAQFECEDYGAGMTGKQIKDAVEHLKEAHDAGKCGNTYLSNTCHITLNYCTDCDVRN